MASDEYWEEYRRVRAALEERYRAELQRAPLFEKIRIRARMRSELKQRMEGLAATEALYIEP